MHKVKQYYDSYRTCNGTIVQGYKSILNLVLATYGHFHFENTVIRISVNRRIGAVTADMVDEIIPASYWLPNTVKAICGRKCMATNDKLAVCGALVKHARFDAEDLHWLTKGDYKYRQLAIFSALNEIPLKTRIQLSNSKHKIVLHYSLNRGWLNKKQAMSLLKNTTDHHTKQIIAQNIMRTYDVSIPFVRQWPEIAIEAIRNGVNIDTLYYLRSRGIGDSRYLRVDKLSREFKHNVVIDMLKDGKPFSMPTMRLIIRDGILDFQELWTGLGEAQQMSLFRMYWLNSDSVGFSQLGRDVSRFIMAQTKDIAEAWRHMDVPDNPDRKLILNICNTQRKTTE